MSDIAFGPVGGNWNTDALWIGGAKPTSGDNAQANASSAALTLDAAGAARSVDFSGYTVTFTHAAGATLSIGDGTPGNSNIALRLASGMTYTLGNNSTSALAFISTSSTVQDIDGQGKSVGPVTFNGVGGKWRFISTIGQVFVASVGSIFTLTNGQLDFNGQTLNLNGFASNNSNVRTIITNGAQIALSSNGVVWNLATVTNLTWNGGTEVFSLANGNAVTFSGGGLTYGTLIRNPSSGSGAMTIVGSNSFLGITHINPNAARSILFTAGTTTTIRSTNGLNIIGSPGKLLTIDSATAAQHTITSSFQQALDYVIIKNSKAVGGPFYAGSHSQDGGGNEGWIFTDPPVGRTSQGTFSEEGLVS